MLSKLRETAAKLLTGGGLERDAKEILRALHSDGSADSDRISAIVEHAKANVPFYQGLLATRLEELPVVDKGMMRADLNAFLAEGANLEAAKRRSTSGSTGVPFTVYMDAARETRNRAGAVASLRYAGGDPFAASVRARAWAKPRLKDRVLNVLKEDYAHNGDHFEIEPVLAIGRWMKRRRNVVVQGYASYLEQIFRVFEQQGVSFEPGVVGAVVSGAEAPTPYLWEASRRLFGVTPRARYSNMELGVLSTSTPESIEHYKVDTSTFHVEILQESADVAVEPGELGRIVVTDLHNKVMPLLRYDTGDLGRFATGVDGRVARDVITDIRGRRLDVLVGGTPEHPHRIHPLAIWGPAATITEIRQFQLRQIDVGIFVWELNADPSAVLESRLRAILDERVGDIASCYFKYVDEVPVLASGKRQFFVNEISDPSGYIDGKAER